MSHKLGDKEKVCRNQASKMNKMYKRNNSEKGKKRRKNYIKTHKKTTNSEQREIKVTATSKPETVQPLNEWREAEPLNYLRNKKNITR